MSSDAAGMLDDPSNPVEQFECPPEGAFGLVDVPQRLGDEHLDMRRFDGVEEAIPVPARPIVVV
ncbi:MAG: hypothetical protein ACRDWA_10900 [Acidimicrobiia bacterium]